MAHHKRRRPKKARAACALCKPWKQNGVNKASEMGECHSDHVRRAEADKAIREHE